MVGKVEKIQHLEDLQLDVGIY